MYYEANWENTLKNQVIPQTIPEDFETFWLTETEKMRRIPIQITRKRLSTPYDKTFYTDLITFNTHDRTVVEALFSCPVNAATPLPCVAEFHGGSGSKKFMPDILATGVCCFSVDVRSQGGTTIDKAEYHSGDRMGSLMTCGLLDKNEFYMKNIYLDAVRAMDVIASLPEVDAGQLFTYGGSQGGALSIVASALSGKSQKCYTAVTSYCCLKERTELASGVFNSTHMFLRQYPFHTNQAMETLRYFDINNMVSLLKVPADFCLALSDAVCLPHFVYSAYDHADCPKKLYMYPFTPHCIPDNFKLVVFQEFADLIQKGYAV